MSDLCLSTHCRCGGILLRLITLSNTHTHSVGLLWTGDRPVAETSLYLYNTQHLQETDIHTPNGIRTRNLSRRVAEDLPTARPSGSTVANFLKQNDVTSHADDDIITAETSVTTGHPVSVHEVTLQPEMSPTFSHTLYGTTVSAMT
jgi:hypothetical protein